MHCNSFVADIQAMDNPVDTRQMIWQSQLVAPPHSGQQPPSDLSPSNKEQEEEGDTRQYLGLAMEFAEGLGHDQMIVKH